MIRGKWKWLLILLAALAVLVGLMALETLLGSVRKCRLSPAALICQRGNFHGPKREASAHWSYWRRPSWPLQPGCCGPGPWGERSLLTSLLP